MRTLACDLHVHSCLSPCADDDMTPYSIAGMAKLNGLDAVALTDHNACGNCETFFDACRHYGIVPVPGMELTTAEEIHVICLFPTLAQAMAFEKEVRACRIAVKNRTDVFGRQLLIGAEDTVAGEEPNLLINATTLPLHEAAGLAWRYGGAAYPAHIDRESNGVIAVLGEMPEEPAFATVEFHRPERIAEYRETYRLGGRNVVIASDAHRLWELGEGEYAVTLNCGDDDQSVRDALIRYLGGGEA